LKGHGFSRAINPAPSGAPLAAAGRSGVARRNDPTESTSGSQSRTLPPAQNPVKREIF
jgi:hypothetical protein